MTPFDYVRAGDTRAAFELAARPGARYLAGGTNLVDLMRTRVAAADVLVDVTALERDIVDLPDGGLRIGAAATNTALAGDRRVRARYPVLSRAVLSGASGQIRNVATVAGNILQRTRCAYFYDQSTSCNKRNPGDGCDARDGFNRMHAILGASPGCVATHPSDMCVALAALDAQVEIQSATGTRTIPLVEFLRLPGQAPQHDSILGQGELVTAVLLPDLAVAARSTYRKVRDRSSYAFALVSVAAALRLNADRQVEEVRLAWGGVAHRPWRAWRAEQALKGIVLTDDAAVGAALEAELADAVPLRHNAFKPEMVMRTTTAVLRELAEAAA